MRRTVFYVSDGTAITSETIGHSLLTQFQGVEFVTHRMPFVRTLAKAEAAATRIKSTYARTGERPIVINTIMDSALSECIAGSGALMLDVFAPFLEPLEVELGRKRAPLVGQAHGVVDSEQYEARIHAMNYALSHDDGMALSYDDADVIIVGVSRVGKTPTSVYMALHFGIMAANYPLTPEDLERQELPEIIRRFNKRLFGLTIDAGRLAQIREQRRPRSRYASMEQCRWELRQATLLLRAAGVPQLNTTHVSVEEISSKIIDKLRLERKML